MSDAPETEDDSASVIPWCERCHRLEQDLAELREHNIHMGLVIDAAKAWLAAHDKWVTPHDGPHTKACEAFRAELAKTGEKHGD